MSLKFYYDLISQPCRSVMLLLKVQNIPFQGIPISLKQGQQNTREFKSINPFQRLPVIDDGGFKLTESHAILLYLFRKYKLPLHWYPSVLEERSRVDEYMAWHHENTRLHCQMYFHQKVRRHPTDFSKIQKWKGLTEQTLDDIQSVWLAGSRDPDSSRATANHQKGDSHEGNNNNNNDRFIASQGDISLADLLAVCELTQPYVAGWDVTYNRPLILDYMNRVKSQLSRIMVANNGGDKSGDDPFYLVHKEAFDVRNILHQQGKIGEQMMT